MRLTVNGRSLDTETQLSVQALVETLTEARRGVAVAVNGEVVPRSAWAAVPLAEGDAVEVLTAAQGG
ncbi:thiamine biosynthesis protein ThiS [Paractinoplanes deccanensis]|uniref:Thiamine biosynthesis protein ThiS n=1 Tax=Paractinoplanes deccanensis TaxID=113561 RepID=A0ABQ3Y256_9ACTN|nr:sulfur carrier protein ThiS [Actinoplanes deccanensis]GID74043.1 thiamine biosynthesis protein ThiS [Actinoplanes deccanensis]